MVESLGDILKRHGHGKAPKPSSAPVEPQGTERCETCQGRAWLTKNVPVGDPDFGRLFPCACQRERIAAEQMSRLQRYSGLGGLTESTFESFNVRGTDPECDSSEVLEVPRELAEHYAEQPVGWLVLSGPTGMGKTHLAAAVANRCIGSGMPVFFTHVPSLLEHLRSAYDPDSEIGHTALFEQVRDAPILVLDELDGDESTAWAHGKLKQIVNHRFNERLRYPTVVTTRDLSSLDPYITSRILAASRIGRGHRLNMGPSVERMLSSVGEASTEMVARMTFESFTIPNASLDDVDSLRGALKSAKGFGGKPWLTFSGPQGVGKTHLAMAVAGEWIRDGRRVFFIEVSDLMDRLRGSLRPDSAVPYSRLVDEIKGADLLVLDGLEFGDDSRWVRDALFVIVNHRYNNRLPTIITTTSNPRLAPGPLASRIGDQAVGDVAVMTGRDYRRGS